MGAVKLPLILLGSPGTTKYQPVPPYIDHHISMSLNVPRDSVPRNKFPRDNVLWNNVPQDNCSSLHCPSQQCPSRQLFLVTIVPRDNCSSRQFFLMTIVPCDNCSKRQLFLRSFAKGTVLQMTKIKGIGEHGLLQMTIWMIRPPPCSSVCLQMVICKEDVLPNDQHFFGQMGLKFTPDLPLV